MRKSPDTRGLKKLLNRPAVKQALMGLTLLVPALGFMARVPELGLGGETAQQVEEQNRSNVVAEAWRDLVEEKPVDEAMQSLADEFKVPVELAADIHEAAVTEAI